MFIELWEDAVVVDGVIYECTNEAEAVGLVVALMED